MSQQSSGRSSGRPRKTLPEDPEDSSGRPRKTGGRPRKTLPEPRKTLPEDLGRPRKTTGRRRKTLPEDPEDSSGRPRKTLPEDLGRLVEDPGRLFQKTSEDSPGRLEESSGRHGRSSVRKRYKRRRAEPVVVLEAISVNRVNSQLVVNEQSQSEREKRLVQSVSV